MHEAGVAGRAVQAAIDQLPPADRQRRPIGLDVRFDPGRIDAGSLTFHLEQVLRELDLAGLPVAVAARSVACPSCATPSSVEAWLLCGTCGEPLPAIGGPIADARFRY